MRGFNMRIYDKKYHVYFLIEDDTKTITCYIESKERAQSTKYLSYIIKEPRYCGKAKIHPEDSFSVQEGQKIAFIRALAKRSEYIERVFVNFGERLNKELVYAEGQLFDRMKKLNDKGKLNAKSNSTKDATNSD